jgi:hypothetical protein
VEGIGKLENAERLAFRADGEDFAGTDALVDALLGGVNDGLLVGLGDG